MSLKMDAADQARSQAGFKLMQAATTENLPAPSRNSQSIKDKHADQKQAP
jgi:hypothetical protein